MNFKTLPNLKLYISNVLLENNIVVVQIMTK